jgi:alpha-1,3-glucan synthase
MPGWWYTVESTTSQHLIKQFKGAIDAALASNQDTRAVMRARSAKQRFPVQQWKEDLNILQTNAIKHHQQEAGKRKSIFSHHHSTPKIAIDAPPVPQMPSEWPLESRSRRGSDASTIGPLGPSNSPSPLGGQKPSGLRRQLSMGVRSGPGHVSSSTRGNPSHSPHMGPALIEDDDDDASVYEDEHIITEEDINAARWNPQESRNTTPTRSNFPNHFNPPASRQSLAPSLIEHDLYNPHGLTVPSPLFAQSPSARSSVLSLDAIVGDKKDFKLQKVDPFFTDSTSEFYNAFESKLGGLSGKNSETELCIEEYLIKSEKSWFDRFRDARLGRSAAGSRAASPMMSGNISSARSSFSRDNRSSGALIAEKDEFLLGDDYIPPTGLKKYLQMKVGDWPAYTILLAFGQIISANSYQITLLTGSVGQQAEKLYSISTVYAITSILWWLLFRRAKAVWTLSTPFFFYGLAFLLLGVAPLLPSANGVFWMQNVATAVYATASSSGALFFAMNFGDEGGAPVKDWVFRACVIQGTQQIYVVALWYWGNSLTAVDSEGAVSTTWLKLATSSRLLTITTPIAVVLWIIGAVVLVGLPDYYRQAPGKVPSLYVALSRRKIVVWTLVAVLVQNYFLSAPYGRNWQFLWSSRAAPPWAVALLVVLFFIVLWAAFLFAFAKFSISHSWFLPIFAIGLGAPRWCQMLWGTSSIGLYLPWAGGAVSSALVSRSLWLWLGLLDTIQGVGFGMIFLQTLTRIHVGFTLLAAQVLGSIATILARLTAPNKIGMSLSSRFRLLFIHTDRSTRPCRCVPRLFSWCYRRSVESMVLGRSPCANPYLPWIFDILPQGTIE